MNNCIKIGLKTDKQILDLGIGKYTPEWLSKHYGTKVDWGYWVDKKIKGYDLIDIENNIEVYHKFTIINHTIRFFKHIFYNIKCFIKHGKTLDKLMNNFWYINK